MVIKKRSNREKAIARLNKTLDMVEAGKITGITLLSIQTHDGGVADADISVQEKNILKKRQLIQDDNQDISK